VNDSNKLQYEREFAKQTREKFIGISSAGNMAQENIRNPAGPASGSNKYGGFGSEDIKRFGYNNAEAFGTGPYDPYTKS
jgi:hypothetical protein